MSSPDLINVNHHSAHPHVCSACRRGLMGEPGAHARLMELEDTLGLEFDGPLASQVIALIEHMTAEAYSELLQAVEKHSLAALIQLIALQNEDSQLEV